MAEYSSPTGATIRALVWALVSVPFALFALGLAAVAAAAVDSALDVAHAPYISLAVGVWPPLATAVALVMARAVGLAVVRTHFARRRCWRWPAGLRRRSPSSG